MGKEILPIDAEHHESLGILVARGAFKRWLRWSPAKSDIHNDNPLISQTGYKHDGGGDNYTPYLLKRVVRRFQRFGFVSLLSQLAFQRLVTWPKEISSRREVKQDPQMSLLLWELSGCSSETFPPPAVRLHDLGILGGEISSEEAPASNALYMISISSRGSLRCIFFLSSHRCRRFHSLEISKVTCFCRNWYHETLFLTKNQTVWYLDSHSFRIPSMKKGICIWSYATAML